MHSIWSAKTFLDTTVLQVHHLGIMYGKDKETSSPPPGSKRSDGLVYIFPSFFLQVSVLISRGFPTRHKLVPALGEAMQTTRHKLVFALGEGQIS